MHPEASELQIDRSRPWQLDMFERSLKKQQKLKALLEILGPLQDERCLLITAGDNNGALNWHFKEAGGRWTWSDAEEDSLSQIQQTTGDPVLQLDRQRPSLPLSDESFDLVLTIDVHEHLQDPKSLNQELARLVKPGGRVIVTTPSGDQTLLANRIKALVGMRPEDYGHMVIGYKVQELEAQLKEASLKPESTSGYAGLFTELIELAINFAYVKVLGDKNGRRSPGQIAPQTEDQLQSVGRAYRLYAALFPILKALTYLDRLTPRDARYAVIVSARKV